MIVTHVYSLVPLGGPLENCMYYNRFFFSSTIFYACDICFILFMKKNYSFGIWNWATKVLERELFFRNKFSISKCHMNKTQRTKHFFIIIVYSFSNCILELEYKNIIEIESGRSKIVDLTSPMGVKHSCNKY